MRKPWIKILFASSLAVALVLATGFNASAWSNHDQEITGTWTVTVQLNNCSGAAIGGPFQSLLTFAGDETMIEDTSNPGFAAGQRGTGHGVWEYKGHRTYVVKSIAFINFTTPPAPPSPGFTAGTQTIGQTVEFNGGPDQWTSDAKVTFADASGQIYRQACAAATANRFE
jgi:hypothetical protein